MLAFLGKPRATKINLTLLTRDILIARQEVSLEYAHTMLWMAKHYQSLNMTEAMKSCARIGIESIKEYKRVTKFLERDKTKTVTIDLVA